MRRGSMKRGPLPRWSSGSPTFTSSSRGLALRVRAICFTIVARRIALRRRRLARELEPFLGSALKLAKLRLRLLLEGIGQLAPVVFDHAAIVFWRLGLPHAKALLDHVDAGTVARVQQLSLLVQRVLGGVEPAL